MTKKQECLIHISSWNKLKIQPIKRKILNNLDAINDRIYDIGECLDKLKKIVGHHNFQQCIKEEFGARLPYPTAAAFKAIYLRFKDQPDLVRYLPVSLLLLMKQKTFPEEALRMIEEALGAVKDNADLKNKINVTAIKEAFKAHKDGNISQLDFVSIFEKSMGFDILRGDSLAMRLRGVKSDLASGLGKLKGGLKDLGNFSKHIGCSYLPTRFLPSDFIENLIQELESMKQDIQNIQDGLNRKKQLPRKVANL